MFKYDIGQTVYMIQSNKVVIKKIRARAYIESSVRLENEIDIFERKITKYNDSFKALIYSFIKDKAQLFLFNYKIKGVV